jgi:hypothetical protein
MPRRLPVDKVTNIRAAYRDLFRASETVRAAIFAAEANCSGVACRSALSSSLSIAML